MTETAPGPFVNPSWVLDHRDRLILVDSRWYLDGSSGRDAYNAGHIPGAVFVDLDLQLSGGRSATGARHPLPSPERFARVMGELGIGDSDSVVVYDDAGGVIAARLVWMLRATGHRAAILDGGLAAYSGPLETAAGRLPPAGFESRPWPADRLADVNEVARPGPILVDARNRDRFEGRPDPVDPRPGHIPGAVNVPCRENVDASGRLLPDSTLLDHFRRAGIESADTVISYCGSGVTACHNLLTLEHLGLGAGRLYVGGWSEYGSAPELPAELGPGR